ncbi:hypothetical protein [Breznakiella homolactica]|uniref:Uncharacterized protein n=1 Tax=Breznakiella homolactica TaxID=2798577 RepID=A0A7T8B9H6_9SPIR|nr:hypothetical protein [Breznakiella homolactica]QQO08462.1 hypothetical protein JFL75_16215 [Breznakiella homolactica]
MLSLSEQEQQLVTEIQEYLTANYPEESELVSKRFSSLKALGEAISLFPSVRENQVLRGEVRSEQDLVKSLYQFSTSSRLLYTPTRVVATRGYLVAKFQSFSMLAMLVPDIKKLYVPLQKVIFSIISTLMAEEVYFSGLDEPSFSDAIKIQLAHDLISIWDTGNDPRMNRHLPALQALWAARDASPPCFGTMNGSSEMMRLSMELGDDWRKFLIDNLTDDETRWALEEFLFGISYEEILEVRSRLNKYGISAVDHNEVRSYLGKIPSYASIENDDPRVIYNFYVERRDAAFFRKRFSLPGPKKTLEELYVKYRIARE